MQVCAEMMPGSVRSGCSTAHPSTSWSPRTEGPACSGRAELTPSCCSWDRGVCCNRGPGAWGSGKQSPRHCTWTAVVCFSLPTVVKHGDCWAEVAASRWCLLMCLNQIIQTWGCVMSMVQVSATSSSCLSVSSFVAQEEFSSPSPFAALALSAGRRKCKTCALRLVFASAACTQQVPVTVLVCHSDEQQMANRCFPSCGRGPGAAWWPQHSLPVWETPRPHYTSAAGVGHSASWTWGMR